MNTTFCGSAYIRHIDKPINNASHIVTGCLRSTPTHNIFILTGIQPTELRRQKPYCLQFAAFRIRNTSYMKGSCLHLVNSCGNLNQDTHLLNWNCRTIPYSKTTPPREYKERMKWRENTSQLFY